MSEHSNECITFAEGIAHPNEKILAREILEGKKVGEFSLDFDQAQADAMTERLKGGGCFPDPVDAPVEEETSVEEETPDEDTESTDDEETVGEEVKTDTPAESVHTEDAEGKGDATPTDSAPTAPVTGEAPKA